MNDNNAMNATNVTNVMNTMNVMNAMNEKNILYLSVNCAATRRASASVSKSCWSVGVWMNGTRAIVSAITSAMWR